VTSSDFVHVYRPPANRGARTLLLLHGTGGDERDLLPLAERLDPSAGVLSPRGKVLEHGMPRFFRRLAEGVFDTEDVRRRAGELAEFVKRSASEHGLRAADIIAVGFSNGANIASAVLLLHPEVLGGAILFRGMVPIEPDETPSLPDTPVFLSNGRQDPLVPAAETERLVSLLKNAGADVTLAWQPSGHQLTGGDIDQAKTWWSGLRV
jgi:phospholipase/carboxylesterase